MVPTVVLERVWPGLAGAITDHGGGLVAIPAGYGIGAWLGVLSAYLIGTDRDGRADLRDLLGMFGGLIGCAFWVIEPAVQ